MSDQTALMNRKKCPSLYTSLCSAFQNERTNARKHARMHARMHANVPESKGIQEVVILVSIHHHDINALVVLHVCAIAVVQVVELTPGDVDIAVETVGFVGDLDGGRIVVGRIRDSHRLVNVLYEAFGGDVHSAHIKTYQGQLDFVSLTNGLMRKISGLLLFAAVVCTRTVAEVKSRIQSVFDGIFNLASEPPFGKLGLDLDPVQIL